MTNVAMEQNTIIYLPTGAGKTFISIMVMKKFHKEVEKYAYVVMN